MKTHIIRMQDSNGVWYYAGYKDSWDGDISQASHFGSRVGAERIADTLKPWNSVASNIQVVESDIETPSFENEDNHPGDVRP